ncbi:unnamed protein product [Medioppia subpectinata]|uniref:F-box domain-containing protein n=1 Tax=Medioppia subpectinata TaxID=1979941 RepID=A0A7R9L1P5_9ACAR|nr:unnamed protein product [Medioppia subpectinata]CAG2113640.1 unnamed protein product [Medioppia subpectinata]
MAQNYSKDSFDRFGDDLCQELLSYMAFKDRFRCECVSKQWQRVVFEGQLALNIKRELFDDNFSQIVSILTKCSNIRRVYSEYEEPVFKSFELIFLVINLCHHLNDMSFIVSEDNVHWINHFMAKFAKQMQCISFDFDDKAMIDMKHKWLKMCVNLTAIHIPFDELSKSRLGFSPRNDLHYKRLNSLHLTFSKSNDNSIDINLCAFELFARNYGHNIKTIGFTINFLIDDEMVNRLTDGLKRMPALIALDVKFNVFVDYLLPLIGLKCPQLKALTVDTSHLRETFKAINQCFNQQLKRLKINVWDYQQLSVDSLNSLKRLTHLKLFLVETTLTGLFFANCHHKWPQLRYLRANRVLITNQLLNALSRLRHIRHMHLSGRPVPTPRHGIQNVVINCPKIDCRLHSSKGKEVPEIEELFRKLMSGQSDPETSSSDVKSKYFK